MIKNAIKTLSSGKLKISGALMLHLSLIALLNLSFSSNTLHSCAAPFQFVEQEVKATILVLPFSKFGYFAPKKVMKEMRAAGDFDINEHTQSRFSNLISQLNEEECAYKYTTLEKDKAYELIDNFRFDKEDGNYLLDVEDLDDESKEALTTDADYILFISQYHVDAAIESKQPAHSVYYDLRKSDLSPLGSSKATGKLFQGKISDPKMREKLVIKSLAKKLCQKISKNL